MAAVRRCPKRTCASCAKKSTRGIEIVHTGNEHVEIAAAKASIEQKCPQRVIVGTEGSAGLGLRPLGMYRLIDGRFEPKMTQNPHG